SRIEDPLVRVQHPLTPSDLSWLDGAPATSCGLRRGLRAPHADAETGLRLDHRDLPGLDPGPSRVSRSLQGRRAARSAPLDHRTAGRAWLAEAAFHRNRGDH